MYWIEITLLLRPLAVLWRSVLVTLSYLLSRVRSPRTVNRSDIANVGKWCLHRAIYEVRHGYLKRCLYILRHTVRPRGVGQILLILIKLAIIGGESTSLLFPYVSDVSLESNILCEWFARLWWRGFATPRPLLTIPLGCLCDDHHHHHHHTAQACALFSTPLLKSAPTSSCSSCQDQAREARPKLLKLQTKLVLARPLSLFAHSLTLLN